MRSTRRRLFRRLAWFSTLLLWIAPEGTARWKEPQSNAAAVSLSGTIFDPSAAFVADAKVSLLSPNGTVIAVTASDHNGMFRFKDVPAGRYRLLVQASGFRDATSEVVASVQPAPSYPITLAISSLSEEVKVSAENAAPRISTETSENLNANNIDRDALDRVPVFDQDYVTMLSRFLSDDSVATSGVSLLVDGIEANGPGVSPSAVQEVKINQNPYSARFARPGRARLEIITKPGTPQFHGTVNFLTRNSVFDATNALAASKAPESRYLGEGSLTGPISRSGKNTFLFSLEQDDDNLFATVHAFGVNDSLMQENVGTPTRHFFTSFRVFHDFANGDQFWIGYFYEQGSTKNQGVGGPVLPEAGYDTVNRESEINISYRHSFSPRWTNQLRFLVGHNDQPVMSNTNAAQTIVEGYFIGGGAQANSERTEAHFDGTDFLTYLSGKHTLVFGADVPDLSRRGADDFTNQQGTYVFGDINAYSLLQPAGFTIQTGNGHLVFWERTVAGFIEDTVRVKPNFSLTAGVRYYFQNYFNNRTTNFAPRLAFAYSPTAKSKTVLRGGGGLFFDRSGPRPIADLLHFNGLNLQRDILSATAQFQIPYPVTPADLIGVPTSLVVLDPLLRIPYILQYSFGVERQITAKSTLSATYVGTRGIDLFVSRDVNAPLPPFYLQRPDTGSGQIRQIQSDGYQKGNSLEVTFKGKPTKWFAGQAQYTLGKIYNDTSGITYFPGNSNFSALDWARSDNDRRNKFDLLGSFAPTQLFSLGVALQAYTGKPVNVITGLDSNGDGVFNDRPDGGLGARNSLHGPGLVNLDVNIEHDFHLKRDDKKGHTLTGALNAFNVLNHPNYVSYIGVIGPDGGPRNPNFGLPTAANPPRRFQLSFEYKF